MSKRQLIRQRRQRERIRNRILVISLVAAGALLVAFALIVPGIRQTQNANATATQAAVNPVIVITPSAINASINGISLGDPNAPVRVDIYEDFRCSACKLYTQDFEPFIIQNYVEPGKVYYTYHTYITIDSYDNSGASYRAANAALCAAEQGHFWDYHDTLFANQVTEDASLFTDERLIAMAQSINVDMTAFNQCYQAKKYAGDINNDIAQAHSLNLTYTPSILVDGTFVTIQQSFDDISTAIEAALAGK